MVAGEPMCCTIGTRSNSRRQSKSRRQNKTRRPSNAQGRRPSYLGCSWNVLVSTMIGKLRIMQTRCIGMMEFAKAGVLSALATGYLAAQDPNLEPASTRIRFVSYQQSSGGAGTSEQTSSSERASTVEYVDLQGEKKTGQFVSLDEKQLIVLASQGQESISTEGLLSIERKGASIASTAGMEIESVDGSRWMVKGIEGKDKQWNLQFAEETRLDGFRGDLLSMKLKTLDGPGEASWKSFRDEPRTTDALIVVRPGGALDRIDGIVKEIRGSKVSFDVDGQIVEAGFEKLAGVLWYRKGVDAKSTGNNSGATKFRVDLKDGSQAVCSKLRFADSNLLLSGDWGDEISLPWNWLVRIECGSGKLASVSSLEMLEIRGQRGLSFGAFDSVLVKSTNPKWVTQRDGRKDLLFPGPGEVVFRVPDGMTKFKTRVQRASEADMQSAVSIEVWVDDQIAYRGELSAEENQLEVEANVQSNKRVRLNVAAGGKLKAGSRVQWLEPRLSK